MIALMSINTELTDCRIEGCSLAIIFHEQEVIWCSTFYAEISDFQVLVFVLVCCWIIALDCIIDFTLDLSDSLRFKYGVLLCMCWFHAD